MQLCLIALVFRFYAKAVVATAATADATAATPVATAAGSSCRRPLQGRCSFSLVRRHSNSRID